MKPLSLSAGSAPVEEARARLAIRLRSLTGRRDYQRFVIVGVARTGSTLLLNLLNAHSEVIAFGELFRGGGVIGWDRRPPYLRAQSLRLRRLLETRPVKFLETAVFRRWPADVAAVGFKLFYHHARSGPLAEVWDYLRDTPELVIIHIKRRNILEQYLSLKVAHATNVWHALDQPATPAQPIRLEPADCLRHFEEVRAQEAACDALFAHRDVLPLSYEDLIGDRDQAMRQVATHLRVRPEPLEVRLRRQRQEPLSRAIANYDELRGHFAGSRWESFFNQADSLARDEEVA